ncbi:hypothetical protein PV703_26250 [Streptomyces sp. ME01-24h]|nr:hypothetical protein [Streptomyces sp. ME19-03-3]MDX3356739.1 hypothetical protein [Streptomyces sp. ME01-24h]
MTGDDTCATVAISRGGARLRPNPHRRIPVKMLSVMKVATVAVAIVTVACGCFLQVF